MDWLWFLRPDKGIMDELRIAARSQFPGVDTQTTARIYMILGEQFGVNPASLAPTTRLVEDLNPDSLDAVELFRCIEKEFRLVVPYDDAENMTTVADLVCYVQRALSSESLPTRSPKPKESA